MLHWSIRPFADVMAGFEPAELQEVQVGSATMLISSVNGTQRIERLISPRPNDYLRPEWQPGQPFKQPKTV